MPVFGVPALSYAHGGIAVAPGMGASAPDGLPLLSFPGRTIETAVVLGGGGNRGAVQVGMMRAVIEHGIVADLFVGTSIGAINGAAFAGVPSLDGVYLAADLWRRIAASDVFPRSRFHGTWRFLERRESVFPIDGLRKAVAGYLRFDRLEDAPVPFVVVATRLEDGCEEWFTEGPAIDAVLASAALPGMYPVVEIGGSHYLDGGIIDNVAISAALAAGAKRIIVLLCGNIESPAPTFNRPFEAMFAAFGLALQSRVRRDLASIPDDVDVVVIEQAGTMMFDPQDFSRVDELIDRGYQAARDVLDEYEAAAAERGSRGRTRRWRSRGGKISRPSPELPQSQSQSAGEPEPSSPPPARDLASSASASASAGDTSADAADDVPPGSTR